jgi:hypothetical protein
LEILKRAKSGGDISPWNTPEKDLRDEVNLRTSKAGYTTRQGNPTFRTKIMGPGIGQSKLNQWPRDKEGNLIGD